MHKASANGVQEPKAVIRSNQGINQWHTRTKP